MSAVINANGGMSKTRGEIRKALEIKYSLELGIKATKAQIINARRKAAKES